jgi:hypothetical protein
MPALSATTLALTDPDSALFWSITATVFATGTLWFLLGGLLRANAALREARAELAELAVAEERMRFARDLHDLLGHDLSLIALKAELAGKLLPAYADAAATEDDIKRLTRSALTQVRHAVAATGARRGPASWPARGWHLRLPGSSCGSRARASRSTPRSSPSLPGRCARALPT